MNFKPDKINKPEQIKTITTRQEFLERINDIRSEISGIRNAVDLKLSFEHIRENLDENPLQDFATCLRNSKEKQPPSMEKDEEYQEIIIIANDFVRRINEVKDMGELKVILEEQKDYVKTLK